MVTRRRFSRNAHKIKLSRREGLEDLLYAEVSRLLMAHDPTLQPPALEAAARLAAVIASQIATQTQTVQRALKAMEDDIADYGTDFVADLVDAATNSVTKKLRRFRPEPLADVSSEKLQLADDWAGPVAGPTMIERHYGIPRSTLYRWQKLDEAIAIQTRISSKPVFPLKQFVDGQPARGLAQVIAALGSQKLAWQWLVTPHKEFDGGPPLDALLKGEMERVIEAAGKSDG